MRVRFTSGNVLRPPGTSLASRCPDVLLGADLSAPPPPGLLLLGSPEPHLSKPQPREEPLRRFRWRLCDGRLFTRPADQPRHAFSSSVPSSKPLQARLFSRVVLVHHPCCQVPQAGLEPAHQA